MAPVEFALEDHLLRVTHASLTPHFSRGKQRVVATREKFAVGMIVPDLLLVINDTGATAKRRPISLFDCSVLSAIMTAGGSTLEMLENCIFARASVIQAALGRLQRQCLVTVRAGRFRISRKVRRRLAHVVAVEAKLIRWKEAVEQAKSYLRFANASYVALPSSVITRLRPIRAACRSAGIGLIAVDATGCRISLRAVRQQPRSGEWLWVLHKTFGLVH